MQIINHLRSRSCYSLLDSTAEVKGLVNRAVNEGMTHLAITDHHNMIAHLGFETASKGKLKNIFGVEMIVTINQDDTDGYPLLFLAENLKGYRNMIKLNTYANSVGKVNDLAMIPLKQFGKYSEGIICLTGGLPGYIGRKILSNQEEDARDFIKNLIAVFGKDNVFLEVWNHGIADEVRMNNVLKNFSKELDVGLVATHDIHYLDQDHCEARAIFSHIGDSMPAWEDHTNYNDQFYFPTQQEMRNKFTAFPEALDNIDVICKRCEGVGIPKERTFPKFPVPEGYTIDTYFEKLCQQGFDERYPTPTQVQKDRLKYEVDMIKQMGFPAYFLITQDFMNWGKERGILFGPGRGSAAGSIVAYCLHITELIDPLEYDLLFERFLNPARISMPDVDIDIQPERRMEVVEYVQQKYGQKNVSQIITIGRVGIKAGIKDIGKQLGFGFKETDAWCKEVPASYAKIAGDKVTSNDWNELWKEPFFANLLLNDERVVELKRLGAIIVGLPRQTGKHAAGVVVGSKPLETFCPMKEEEGILVTQWTMGEVEKIGLLKLDFLGLQTLTGLGETLRLVKESEGIDLNLEDIPFSDQKAFELLSEGNTGSIFQLESGGMRRYLKELKPSAFTDVIAMTALYR